MAPVEEGLVWLSGYTSSLQISIVSVLFIIIYVTLHSLCAGCYSGLYSDRRETKNLPFTQNKAPEQVSRNLNRLEHALPLPSLPSDPTAHLESQRHRPSFHRLGSGNSSSCSQEYTTQNLNDHTYALLDNDLNEENPYDYISEPPMLLSDKPEDDNERQTLITPKLLKLDVNHSDITLDNPVNNREMEQSLAVSDRCLTCTEPTAVYATVNWETKSPKNTEPVFNTFDVDEMSKIPEDIPPVPQKLFKDCETALFIHTVS